MKSFILLLVNLVLVAELFAQGKQLTGQHAPAASPALAPAEAQKVFSVPPGFEVHLFAAEPDVVNPVAMTWDDRGRLWVVELYEYPMGAAPGTKPRDNIKILEDTDNDGRADKVTVFAEGLNLATGILYGNGGVYVGQAPDLLFLEDTNGDDVADKRTVLLTGFGLYDRHELLNGFTWGPDGQLYMTHGVFSPGQIKIPEATEPGVQMDAAVARFDPRTRKFEIYADGTSNPWGVDFDKYGNAFVSACVIDHLFHMAAGGIYQRQGGVPGNPYAYELLPSIVKHKHHMAAYAGICIYQGDNFPEEYRGRVFMGNIHQNAINHDRLIPNGSSFTAEPEKDFLTTTDGWFRPVSEQTGPDGALWIADWYDKYPCYQNARADPEGVDRTYGRIWRVVYTGGEAGKKIGSRPQPNMDLSKLDWENHVKLLAHSNVWQRRAAQRLLIERVRMNSEPSTTSLLNTLDGNPSLPIETKTAAFWVFNERAKLGRGLPLFIYWDPNVAYRDQSFRAGLAAKHIGDTRNSSAEAMSTLEKAAADPDPATRLAVATACRQLVSSSLTLDTDINTEVPVGKILVALIKSSADAKDPLIPFMIWMASEPLVARNPAPGLQWLAENGADTMPLSGILARKTMRRICDTGEPAKMDAALNFLAAIKGNDDNFILAALDGLIEGQKAKALQPTGDTTVALAKCLESASPRVKERLHQLGTVWGDAKAVEGTLKTINDQNVPVEDRIKSVQSAGQLKTDAARAAMVTLISNANPEPLVIEGLRALSTIGGDGGETAIVRNWKNFPPAARRTAADVLVSRSSWVNAFLDAVKDKTISPSEISASVMRTIANYKNENFNRRMERFVGKYREPAADKVELTREKRKAVLNGEPNFARGHELTTKACLVCHKFYGEGAEVGPDLTGVGRSTLDALLANVIDPNQIIGKGYENVMIETKDGRSVSGRMVENSDSQIKLLAAGPVENVVAKSDIASMKVSELSVMPEGLEQMSDADFRDMIWFILNPPQEGPLTIEKYKVVTAK